MEAIGGFPAHITQTLPLLPRLPIAKQLSADQETSGRREHKVEHMSWGKTYHAQGPQKLSLEGPCRRCHFEKDSSSKYGRVHLIWSSSDIH